MSVRASKSKEGAVSDTSTGASLCAALISQAHCRSELVATVGFFDFDEEGIALSATQHDAQSCVEENNFDTKRPMQQQGNTLLVKASASENTTAIEKNCFRMRLTLSAH